ncbi:MAG: arginine--tRNA ligase, partial [Polyangiaceae bacterium]|nr:arginine--tRNA ligase [Polyangiaceae bacterium]
MGVEEQVRSLIAAALADLAGSAALPPAVAGAPFSVERPRRPEHGDLATNAPLAVQKLAGKPPRDVAALLADRLRAAPEIVAVDIAGPGFLTLRLAPAVYHRVLGEVLAAGPGYGRAPAALGERVLLEFVSANPTGPLLISHGRGAILGDAVGALLEATGSRVTREYYINDFGNQIRLLAESVRAALEGRPAPEGGYGADYVRELAAWIRDNDPAAVEDPDPGALGRVAVSRMLDGVPGSKVLPGIRRTLADLGIHHDVWFSEEGLHRWGRVRAALAELARGGYLEERDGALFFRARGFGSPDGALRPEPRSGGEGDDKDRVVRKQDGHTTYFASDIAYHADKIARGYDRLLVVLGADHHGYTARVRGALRALGLPSERFEVLLYQLVNLLRDGKPVKMGKRLGNLITIEEVVQEIDEAAGRRGAGADALRYF